MLPCDLPLPKNDANFTRCASPPLNVFDDCPSFTYPKPTSDKGCMAFAIAIAFLSPLLKNSMGQTAIDLSENSFAQNKGKVKKLLKSFAKPMIPEVSSFLSE